MSERGAALREMRGHLSALGFELERRSGNEHELWTHPEFGTETLAFSSSRKWRDNKFNSIAQKLGLSKPELEVRLGVRSANHRGPKKTRRRNDAGRKARRFTAVKDETAAPSVRIGTPKERMAEIAEEIRAVTLGLNTVAHDSEEYWSLLDEDKRLRLEYCEAESAARYVA